MQNYPRDFAAIHVHFTEVKYFPGEACIDECDISLSFDRSDKNGIENFVLEMKTDEKNYTDSTPATTLF